MLENGFSKTYFLEYSDGCFALGAVLVHGVDLWISLRVSNIMDHYRGHLLHAGRMVGILHRRDFHLRIFRLRLLKERHQLLYLPKGEFLEWGMGNAFENLVFPLD